MRVLAILLGCSASPQPHPPRVGSQVPILENSFIGFRLYSAYVLQYVRHKLVLAPNAAGDLRLGTELFRRVLVGTCTK